MQTMGQTVSTRNASLDGLRTLAITLIVASHCDFLNQGGLGNAIFFCLSGFLAAFPFSQDAEERFSSIPKIGQYYWNRIMRIIPTFWAVLFFLRVTCGLQFFNTNSAFVKNLFFIESFGHLWFLQQEMVMYLVLPALMLLLLGLKRVAKRLSVPAGAFDLICALVLAVLAYLSRKYLTAGVFSLNGNGSAQVFRIWQFLIGMVTAYLYKAYRAWGLDLSKYRLFRFCADGIVLVLLLGCVFSSTSFLSRIDPSLSKYYVGWYLPVLCSSLTGVAIVLLLSNPKGILTRFLGCRLFSELGKISFGIYLIHFFLIPISGIRETTHFRKFLFIYLMSIGFALLLHKFVEAPSGIFAKTKRLKDVLAYYRSL